MPEEHETSAKENFMQEVKDRLIKRSMMCETVYIEREVEGDGDFDIGDY